MKKLFITGFILLFVVAGVAFAQNRSTAEDAKAMLDKAVAFYKANGPKKAFAAFNDPKGQFVKRDLYVFAVDLNGKTLAHGSKRGLIGKSMNEIRDADEKNFIEEMVETAKTKGTGIVDYKWENPQSLIVEQKSAYIEKVGDVVLGCGYYKGYKWQQPRY